MVKCVVSGCPNRKNRPVTVNRGMFRRPLKRFFDFPKNPARVKVWLAALRETDKQDSTEQHVICEDHFLPEDITAGGVKADAIPLMPPDLDGPMGLIGSWGGEVSEEEDLWATGDGEEEEEAAASEHEEDEAPAEVAPPPAAAPAQQDPPAALHASPGAKPKSVGVHESKDAHVKAFSRQDVSLGLLTRRFLELLLTSPERSLDISQAAASLQTRKRRVYDITNVLEGIDVLRRSTNRISWVGPVPISCFLRKDEQKMQRELENMKLVENTLDGLIKTCAQQLFDMTDDVDNSASAYITHEDVSRVAVFQEQTVIVVRASEETKLEIPTPTEDAIQIHLKGGRGPITAVTCDVGAPSVGTGEKSCCFTPLEDSRIKTSMLLTG